MLADALSACGSIVAIGHRAASALGRSGDARVLAPLTASMYIVAGSECLWLAGPAAVLHPRAVVLTSGPAAHRYAVGDRLRLSDLPRPWRPQPWPLHTRAVEALRGGAVRLAAAVGALGVPVGIGARLVGAPLRFPLTGAGARIDDLAAACARDDPAEALEAALGLLGLGPGLTPSGDDFVGAAFFARLLLARSGTGDAARWQAAAEAIRAAAARRTHPISAALLGDLLDGETWEPLHTLVGALGRDDAAGAREAARRLVRLGHSSGWDLLAGFLAGAAR